jgi:hypothetical protein
MILPIENGEIGSSVRAKLNQSIQAINELPLTEIENQGIAIANLTLSQDTQDEFIAANTSAIAVLNTQAGVTLGIDRQATATRPLLNSLGQPLKDNDLWFNTETGEEAIRKSLNWLGAPNTVQGYISNMTFTNNFVAGIPYEAKGNIRIEEAFVKWTFGNFLAGTNSWQLQVTLSNTALANGGTALPTYTPATASGEYRLSTSQIVSGATFPLLRLWCLKVGSPTGLFAIEGFTYRDIL